MQHRVYGVTWDEGSLARALALISLALAASGAATAEPLAPVETSRARATASQVANVRFRIPAGLMLAISVPKDFIEARFFPGKSPRFNQHSIRLLTSGKYGTNHKACRELGLSPTPIRQAFRDSVSWFRDNGYF